MTIADQVPFAHLERTPLEHFHLHYYAGVAWLLGGLVHALDGLDDAAAAFPFVEGYLAELRAQGREPGGDGEAWWWTNALQRWEAGAGGHLPLRTLRVANAVDPDAVAVWMVVGLLEEDPRFGRIFDTLQHGGGTRPTFGLLEAWGRAHGGALRAPLLRLIELGWLRVANPEAPRPEWALQVPTPLWDALQGVAPAGAERPRYRSAEALVPLERLIVSDGVAATLRSVSAGMARGELDTVVVRGPGHSGRRTVVGALARAVGRGVLEVDDADDVRLMGHVATALDAVPVLARDLAPGDALVVPAPLARHQTWAVVAGRQGGVVGLERSVTVELAVPGPRERRAHWRLASGDAEVDVGAIAERYRLSSGQIRRVATLARTAAAIAGGEGVGMEQVRSACRDVGRHAFETLASPAAAGGDWDLLAVSSETEHDLRGLEQRIVQRERLGDAAGAAFRGSLGPGVRALFSGPSGTGKTLAARVLATSLHLDLYVLDVSRLVDKYIGETEKNLERVLALAEELGVMLLLDEGDSLLTQRTGVHSAHDRYANLETNYLLQRLETFEGILIVTTNASERIDRAFQRRMDVVVEFRWPEAAEREAIWSAHLPSDHAVPGALLVDIARRCALSGGQIRNAALHATLLSLAGGGPVDAEHLTSAVRREYRKLGQSCPLPPGGRA